ncbi:flagellar type III secretion system pore protein FliP [Endozoicomonas ascidiicola]|uniref:flagellar type III secretion system pore protein FliP n=1 Tax=Endozoicomonas ascidiicola TaxID=1698521 RepID=UPI00082AC059
MLLFAPAALGNIPLFQMTQASGGQEYSASLQILLLLTSLSFLPAVLLVMTSFTRIIIVLSLLRQALGVQQIPPNPVLVGLALFLTLFIMQPVLDQVYVQAVEPYMQEEMTLKEAASVASVPVRGFMLRQTRESDLVRMLEISGNPTQLSADEIPFSVLIPSFILSELKTAFQIGFMLFIPFLVIDMVVASVLMAMGMMMLSPLVISLPFKLMLFVLADGWGMTVGTLAASFG